MGIALSISVPKTKTPACRRELGGAPIETRSVVAAGVADALAEAELIARRDRLGTGAARTAGIEPDHGAQERINH
jgi:hypothetical protein